MNTTIELVNLESGAHRIVTLVYPEHLELVPEGVSVLAPSGIARIGSQEGDVLRCPERESAR
jgi:regulator of nucleoside diphosphate kinase